MSLKEKLIKQLPKELQQQVFDALGDDFDYDMVPRSRLNKVIKQRNEYKEALDGVVTPDGEEDGDEASDKSKNLEGLISKKELDKALADAKLAAEKQVLDLKIQYVALDKLREAKAIDPDLILKSGAIDVSKTKFNDKGELEGLKEQLDELVKSKAFLFKTEDEPGRGTGRSTEDKSTPLDAQLQGIFSGYGVTPAE